MRMSIVGGGIGAPAKNRQPTSPQLGHTQPSNPSKPTSVTFPDRSVTFPESAVTFPNRSVTIGRNTQYPDNGQGVSEFIIRNRARNRTGINPLKVYEARTHAFLPGFTRAYFDLAGSVSFEARQGNTLYLDLLRAHFPEALCCPILSGSALVRPSLWSVSYYVNWSAMHALRWASMHPRLARVFGFDPLRRDFPASQFLDPATTIDETDPWVESSQVIDLGRRGELTAGALKLHFQWTAWRRLHAGRLHSLAAPAART